MLRNFFLKGLQNYHQFGKPTIACFLVVSLMVAMLSGIDVGASIESKEYLLDTSDTSGDKLPLELASPSDEDDIIEEDLYEEATDSNTQRERPLWEQREGAQIYGVLKHGVDLTKIDLDAKKGRRAAVANRDVTTEIKVTEKRVYFNGKLVWDQDLGKDQPKPPDKLYSDFTFRIDMGWEGTLGYPYQEGDFFTIPIMSSQGLPFKITAGKVWSGTLSIDGLHVADAELKYENGTLSYQVVFNQNIKYFEELAGYYSYSVALALGEKEYGEKREFKFGNEYTWEPTIEQTPVKPSDDKITWEWPTVPEISRNQIGMGKGALSLNPTANPPGGQWRVLFVDFLNEAQAVALDGEYPSYENVIIEDTLDANQEFANTRLWWQKDTLFHFDIPVMLKGTQMAFHYNTSTGTSPVNEVTLDWGGESYYAITSEDKNFKEYKTEAEVRANPLSWAIVWENGCQKLIINCGKLGPLSEGEKGLTTDMIEPHQKQEGFPVYSNLVSDMDDQIDAWEADIINLRSDYYSPLESMNRLLDKVYAALKSPTSNVETSWQKFRAEVETYIGTDCDIPPTGLLPVIPSELNIIANHADYKKMAAELQGYAENQAKYKDNKATYVAKYEARLTALIDSMKETRDFYNDLNEQGNKAVYGFCLMYKTNYINLSSDYTSVSNKVKITSDGHVPYVSDVTKDFKHDANISGKFKNGDLVVIKADSGYGYNDDTPLNSKDKLVGLKDTEFQVYRKGAGGAPDTLLYFFDKTLNADGAYVYNKTATAQQLPDIRQSIVTNENGVAVLSGLPILGSYYLKEVGTPEGYYDGQNEQVEFNVSQTKVSYKVVNNVPRSVTLKKVDADNLDQGLSGAVFELFQEESDVKLSGFQKRSIAGKDVFAYTGQSTNQDALKTQSDGTLTIQGLASGTYYLKEKEAPSGYILSQIRHSFEVKNLLPASGITNIDIGKVSNVKKKTTEGSVQLKKTDKTTGNGLAGVSFQLYKDSDQTLYSDKTYKTDSYGEIEVNHLPIGSYYFKEIATLPEYVLDSTPIKFTLDAKTVEQAIPLVITAVNEKKPEASTEAPTTEAPTTEAPTTEAPTTEAPTTEAPTTEAPTTVAPTTEAPTTETPTTPESTAPQPTTASPTKPTNSGSGSDSGSSSTVTTTSPSKETEVMTTQTSVETSQPSETVPTTRPQPSNPEFINPPGDRGSIVVGPDERYYFIDDGGVPKAVWDVVNEKWVIIEAEDVPLGFYDGQAVVMTLGLPKTGERPLPLILLTLFCGGLWLAIYQRKKNEDHQ